MPFKWNASSLQLLPGTLPGSGSQAAPGGAPRQAQQPPPVSQHQQNQQQRSVNSSLNTLAFGGGGGGGGGGIPQQHPPPPKYPGRDNRQMGQPMDRQMGGGRGGNQGVSDLQKMPASQKSQAERQDSSSRSASRRDGAPSIGRIGESSSRQADRGRDSRDREPRRGGGGGSSPSRKRSRSPEPPRKTRARSRTRSRSRSPPRRRQRTSIPRYSVSVPKIPLNFPSSCVADLRKRYTNM